ncbi:hypothetical protein AAY473_032203 [Plecturocebus cupreus]
MELRPGPGGSWVVLEVPAGSREALEAELPAPETDKESSSWQALAGSGLGREPGLGWESWQPVRTGVALRGLPAAPPAPQPGSPCRADQPQPSRRVSANPGARLAGETEDRLTEGQICSEGTRVLVTAWALALALRRRSGLEERLVWGYYLIQSAPQGPTFISCC